MELMGISVDIARMTQRYFPRSENDDLPSVWCLECHLGGGRGVTMQGERASAAKYDSVDF